jgi:hypothetical protein
MFFLEFIRCGLLGGRLVDTNVSAAHCRNSGVNGRHNKELEKKSAQGIQHKGSYLAYFSLNVQYPVSVSG